MSADAARAAKDKLRAEIYARRRAMDPADQQRASARMCERAATIVERARPRVLAIYHALANEADPAALARRAEVLGVRLALPAEAADDTMVFRPWQAGGGLVPAGFGTMGPPPEAGEVDPDFMVAPLVGFDRRGYRLGHGMGHFDRIIARLRANGRAMPCLGFAFACQEVPAVPAEPHDVRMDWIVTENEIVDVVGAGGG